MSIFRQTATMLLKEHKHKPIIGDVVTIGRQTVLLTVEEARRLIESEGIKFHSDFAHELDTKTVGAGGGGYQFITDRCFFSMFGSARVRALDVSDYEGAEIVHDLNAPSPPALDSIADFIFNGSCLDNLFDPATAIKSLSRMLRPGGRIVHLEHGTPIQDAILCYSPEWFFDFYAANDYADCQLYVCTFPDSLRSDWRLFLWLPYCERSGALRPSSTSLWIGDFINIVIAEKGTSSSDDRAPIQSHYRTFHGANSNGDAYLARFLEFTRSPRVMAPLHINGKRPDLVRVGTLAGETSLLPQRFSSLLPKRFFGLGLLPRVFKFLRRFRSDSEAG